MTHFRKHFAIAALALAAAAGAGAKTLVFCSEGSPENFYPGVNTTGTSFDGNEPIYNRIVELVPLPKSVSPVKALGLDSATLKLWREELAWKW